MKFIIAILKEIIESLIRNSKLIFIDNKNSHLIDELREDGITLVGNILNSDECKNLRNKIDGYINNNDTNVWRDEIGADNRIYFINEIDSDFEKIYSDPFIRDILRKYTGIHNPVGMLLAARIDAKQGNVGSGGGWHRDSPTSHQFKAIFYLSDVSEINGPFQFIKGSHKKSAVIKAYLRGIFKPGQFRFNKREIKNFLADSKSQISDIVAPEGSLIFADTKGLHQGKPILEGSRYVLFCYFWENSIPSHFKKLTQNALQKN